MKDYPSHFLSAVGGVPVGGFSIWMSAPDAFCKPTLIHHHIFTPLIHSFIYPTHLQVVYTLPFRPDQSSHVVVGNEDVEGLAGAG